MSASSPTQQPAWKALEAHRREIEGRHLRDLFSEDPRRGERLCLETVGLYLDYSKNRITDETLRLLFELAEASGLRARIDALRDEKVKVIKAIRPLTGRSLVRGQFESYRDEEGVARDSQVETFAAMQLHLDSWRWADVPIFIRAGKRLPVTATEVFVTLRRPPQQVFSGIQLEKGPPNHLRFRLGPEVEIGIGAQVKAKNQEPGAGEAVELLVCEDRTTLRQPYDRLLGDAMAGDALLFAREDEVEAAWRIVNPILRHPSAVHAYSPGSWGPKQADSMIARFGGWNTPRGNAPAPD